jgi:hypothetical protein
LNLSTAFRSNGQDGVSRPESEHCGENPNCVKPFHAQTVLYKPLSTGFVSQLWFYRDRSVSSANCRKIGYTQAVTPVKRDAQARIAKLIMADGSASKAITPTLQ